MMKRILISVVTIILVFIGQFGNAQNDVNIESSALSPVMKQMGNLFSLIGKQIKDPSKNVSTLAAAAELEKLIHQSFQLVPPKIAALPVDQQPNQILAYKSQMTKVLDLCLNLQAQLKDNDNKTAIETAKAMAMGKSDGHDAFK